jgi:hypothetical protein
MKWQHGKQMHSCLGVGQRSDVALARPWVLADGDSLMSLPAVRCSSPDGTKDPLGQAEASCSVLTRTATG